MIAYIYIVKSPYHAHEWLIGTDETGKCLFEQDLISGFARSDDMGINIDIYRSEIVDELNVLNQYNFTTQNVQTIINTKHKCICDIVSIMKQGCQCGGE